MAARESKGAALERRVARIEFAEGALVAMRFPVRVAGEDQAHDITDLDVVAIEFDGRLRPTVSVFECKSVRGQKAEADRLLALAGLQKFVKADRAVLVRETVTGRGRAIARALDVEITDTKQLESREANHVWVPESFGPAAGPRSLEVHKDASRTLKTIGDFPYSLLDYLRFRALLDEPHRVLGGLATLGDHNRSGTRLPRRVEGTVMSNALVALIVAALRTAGRIDSEGTDRLQEQVELGLIAGTPHDDSIYRIARLADALIVDQAERIHRLYVENGAQRAKYDLASVRSAIAEVPAWIDRYIDLAVRLRSRSSVAREVPQLAQLVCFDAFMGDNHWQAPSFDHLFTLEHRQLLVVAIDLLGEIVESDLAIFSGLRSIDFDRGAAIRDRSEVYEPEDESDGEADSGRLAQRELFQPEEAP